MNKQMTIAEKFNELTRTYNYVTVAKFENGSFKEWEDVDTRGVEAWDRGEYAYLMVGEFNEKNYSEVYYKEVYVDLVQCPVDKAEIFESEDKDAWVATFKSVTGAQYIFGFKKEDKMDEFEQEMRQEFYTELAEDYEG